MKEERKKRINQSIEFLFPWLAIKRRQFSKRDVKNIKNDVGRRVNIVQFVIAFLCFVLSFSLNLYMDINTNWHAAEVYGVFAQIGRYVLMFGSIISMVLFFIARFSRNKHLVHVLNRISIIILYLSASFYMLTGFFSDAEMGYSTKSEEALSASIVFIAILVLCQPAYWLDAFLLDISTSVSLLVLSIYCRNTYGMTSIEYYMLIVVVYPIICWLVVNILFFAESQHYIEKMRIERLNNNINYDVLTKCKTRFALDEYLKTSPVSWERTGNKLNKLSQVDFTFFLFGDFFFEEGIMKTSLLYGLFKKLGIIYLVSKQTPLVNIPNIVQASLRQVATAATL